MADTSQAQIEAVQRYNAKNTTLIQLRLNYKTDADILARLDQVESKAGYIKDLIRRDIGSTAKTDR